MTLYFSDEFLPWAKAIWHFDLHCDICAACRKLRRKGIHCDQRSRKTTIWHFNFEPSPFHLCKEKIARFISFWNFHLHHGCLFWQFKPFRWLKGDKFPSCATCWDCKRKFVAIHFCHEDITRNQAVRYHDLNAGNELPWSWSLTSTPHWSPTYCLLCCQFLWLVALRELFQRKSLSRRQGRSSFLGRGSRSGFLGFHGHFHGDDVTRLNAIRNCNLKFQTIHFSREEITFL
mmetsp:Transcript_42127/g.75676  ORF Transcript_42127/g.75676 Transcript_42127/m.75676 type:complete len:231 (-) Transcript_42127:3225-3917(-)